MTTITIQNKNAKAKELVAISREEYKEFTPTAAQKQALEQSRKAHERG